MAEILLETVLCLLAASVLMIYHEGVKIIVYAVYKGKNAKWKASPWKIWRYLDPIGLLFSVTSFVPVSKPFFFRIHDKKTNLMLGVTGFLSLLAALAGSVAAIWLLYGGLDGMEKLVIVSWQQKIAVMLIQYLALLSFGMLLANCFPVSTFDMGLVIAGCSSKAYLNIIKSDGIIKMLFLLVLLLDMIHFATVRLLLLIL